MGTIAQAIETILGPSQVTPWEGLSETWQGTLRNAIAADILPECIAYPTTSEQLAEVVACAAQNQWRLLPCGHGSKLSWGAIVAGADLVISTQALNQVVEHAEGDLTVTVQSGAAFAELQTLLLKTRQFLAIDPAYPTRATLGGIVASRDTGALRQRYGGIRDMLIGVTFVRHDGQVAKAGGRVVKNVAGYDLMKLMSGSFGTLGTLTQLTLRTYPLQEASRTVLLTGTSDAIRAMTGAILLSSLPPVKMDLISAGLLSECDENSIGLALQFQSIEAGVLEQVRLLQTIAHPYELQQRSLTAAADEQFWQHTAQTLYSEQLDQSDASVAIAKIGILPAQTVDLLTLLQATLATGTWQARIHASSGIGTLRMNCQENSWEQLQKVRSRCQAAGGYLNLLAAPAAWKQAFDPWGLDSAAKMMMSRLQDKFDPQRRLSPGRMG